MPDAARAMRTTLVCLLTLLAVGGRSLCAQDSTSVVAWTTCTDHLPPSVFNRVTVFAYVHVDQGANRDVRFAAENFLPDVAAAVARLLRAPAGALPNADSIVDWRWADGSIRVTAFGDGRMTWQTGAAPHPDGATQLLARALASADSAGARVQLFAVGGKAPPDSIVFWIKTGHPTVSDAGEVTPPKIEGAAIPVFTRSIPWEDYADLNPGMRPPEYPEAALENGAEASVIVEFVIDTSGRVRQSTVREKWPAHIPPLKGELGPYWGEFVRAVHDALLGYRYFPARLGGCPVSQLVTQRFGFTIGRP